MVRVVVRRRRRRWKRRLLVAVAAVGAVCCYYCYNKLATLSVWLPFDTVDLFFATTTNATTYHDNDNDNDNADTLLLLVLRTPVDLQRMSHGSRIGDDHRKSRNQTMGTAATMSTTGTPKPANTCSCTMPLLLHNNNTTLDDAQCCQRRIICVRKFGHIATRDLFRPRKDGIPLESHLIVNNNNNNNKENATFVTVDRTTTTTNDYRHAVFIRNIWNAVVSGYLYQKDGFECWKGYDGRPVKKGRIPPKYLTDWQKLLRQPLPHVLASNEPSLCHYLQVASSVEDGMRVYMDWVFTYVYQYILPYADDAMQQQRNGDRKKTLFVCYELLTSERRADVFQTVVDFLFPPPPPPGVDSDSTSSTSPWHSMLSPPNVSQREIQKHSTNPDPALRQQLRQIAMDLDRTVFDNQARAIQDVFQCGE